MTTNALVLQCITYTNDKHSYVCYALNILTTNALVHQNLE